MVCMVYIVLVWDLRDLVREIARFVGFVYGKLRDLRASFTGNCGLCEKLTGLLDLRDHFIHNYWHWWVVVVSKGLYFRAIFQYFHSTM